MRAAKADFFFKPRFVSQSVYALQTDTHLGDAGAIQYLVCSVAGRELTFHTQISYSPKRVICSFFKLRFEKRSDFTTHLRDDGP